MKINSPFLNKLGGLLGAKAIRAWMSTLDYKVAYYDPAIDPAFPECKGQKIYIFWHEYILFPIHFRGHCNLAMLLSRHRDAEVLSYAAYHLGFEFVRGSTNRGGVAAIRELLRKSQDTHLTITPDGPRGPRRHLAPGPIYLASRLGMPLVAMGFAYDRPWRLASWDRFAIPRPFSRARTVLSPDIHVPADLDRQGLEHYRRSVERLMNRLCDEAQAWANSDTRKIGQLPIQHGPVRYHKKPLCPIRVARPERSTINWTSRVFGGKSHDRGKRGQAPSRLRFSPQFGPISARSQSPFPTDRLQFE